MGRWLQQLMKVTGAVGTGNVTRASTQPLSSARSSQRASSAPQRLRSDSLVVQPGPYGKHRVTPPVEMQEVYEKLRTLICPQTSFVAMAETSGHLQNNFTVQTLGITSTLSGSRLFKGPPQVKRQGAHLQQLVGTGTNQFAHLLSCNLTLNGYQYIHCLKTPAARMACWRAMGGGMLAAVPVFEGGMHPSALNLLDMIVEDYDGDLGTAAALEHAASMVVAASPWDGSGVRVRSTVQLAELLAYVDREGWRPRAAHAYELALTKLKAELQDMRVFLASQPPSDGVHELDLAIQSLNMDDLCRAIEAKARRVKIGVVDYHHMAETMKKDFADEPPDYMPDASLSKAPATTE